MSECKYARQLGAYHDGELPPAQAAEVEEHARRCSACAADLARIRALSQMLKSAQGAQLPPAVLERLHRRVDLTPAVSMRRMAEAVAAVAAVVLVTCSALLATASGGSRSAGSLPEGWEMAAVWHATEQSTTSADEQLAVMIQDLSRESAHE